MSVKFSEKKNKNVLKNVRIYMDKEISVGAGIPPELGGMPHPKSKAGDTIYDIALANHEGHGDVPARPFIRQYMQDNQVELRQYIDEIAKVIMNDGDVLSVCKKIEQEIRDGIVQKIDNKEYVPNAESTIRRKKSDTPLVDSGILRGSIRGKTEIKRK